MALTINTNLASIKAQHALEKSTTSLNKSMERMTTGYKINSAKDDTAGITVATKMETKLSSVAIAEQNLELGSSMLDTLEGNYGVLQDHLQRIRDLTEQSANGTYSSDSLLALKSEISQRLDEMSRVSASVEYNDLFLLNGDLANKGGLDLQVGITSSENSVIHLDASLFSECIASSLTWKKTGIVDGDGNAVDVSAYGINSNEKFAEACAGLNTTTGIGGTKCANKMLAVVDAALSDISKRTTLLGATQNRIDSSGDALQVQSDNLTSSLSTVRDADVASESSAYISAQILQQASATLLASANQTPSIALNLI